MKPMTNKEFLEKNAATINGLVSHFDTIAALLDFKYYHYYCVDKTADSFCLRDTDVTYFSCKQQLCSATFEHLDADYTFKFDVSASLNVHTELVKVNRIKLDFENIENPLFTHIIHQMGFDMFIQNTNCLSAFVLKNSDIIQSVYPSISFTIDGEIDDIALNFLYKKQDFQVDKPFKTSHYYTNSLTIYNKALTEYHLDDDISRWKDFSEMIFFSIINDELLEMFSCDSWNELLAHYEKNKSEFISVLSMHNY